MDDGEVREERFPANLRIRRLGEYDLVGDGWDLGGLIVLSDNSTLRYLAKQALANDSENLVE